MHAAHPIIAIWDDHESTNNPRQGGAQNHQPDTEGEWRERRDAPLQAYFEWMPVRESEPGNSRVKLWRHFAFGDLASLTTLETRHTGRSLQIEYSGHLEAIDSSADRNRFLQDILGDSSRTMLSSDMESFLSNRLETSLLESQTWRLTGNQIQIARTHVPDVASRLEQEAGRRFGSLPGSHRLFSRLGRLDLPLYLDTWDGYPAARERFYKQCREAGVRDDRIDRRQSCILGQ